MSTSLLVTKMEAYVKSIGEEVEIRAVGQDRAKSELKKVDVVLIGPQMSFLKRSCNRRLNLIGFRWK